VFFDLLQMKSKWNKMYAKMLATLRRSQRLPKRQYWTSHAKDTSSRTIEQKDESALLQYSYSGSATVFLRCCYSTATVTLLQWFCYSAATVTLLQWFATVLLQWFCYSDLQRCCYSVYCSVLGPTQPEIIATFNAHLPN